MQRPEAVPASLGPRSATHWSTDTGHATETGPERGARVPHSESQKKGVTEARAPLALLPFPAHLHPEEPCPLHLPRLWVLEPPEASLD